MSEEAFSVALRVAHPTYKPEVISDALGMTPDVANCVGSARATPTGSPLEGEYKETYCAFTLQSKQEGYFVDGVRVLIPLIESHADFFSDVKSTGGKSELYIGVFVEESAGFTLLTEDMAALWKIGLDLSVEYYY